MPTIYLAEITAAINSGGSTTVLRYTSGKGYVNASAPGYYAPRIRQAANISRNVFDDQRTFGASRVAYGELVLNNTDGGLDGLLEYGYGRSAKILIGDETDDYSDFITVLEGTVEQPECSLTEVIFRFRDRQQELELPIQPSKFAGTNSGATGIEGLPDDIKGQPKPRVWGKNLNISPILLNASKLIYGVNFDKSGNTEAIQSVDAVYDGGVALTPSGTDRANLAALQGATISAGQYDTCLAEGLIRLGSTPSRQITMDVTEGSASSNRHAADIIKRILLDAGVDASDISSSDISTLESDAGYLVGAYVADEASYREIIDRIAGSVGAWYSPDRLGVYRIKQLKAPSGTAVSTFKRFNRATVAMAADGDIISIQRVVTSDPGRGVPAHKVNLNYALNGTVQPAGELAGSVTDARRAFLERPYRTVTDTDATIQDQFLQAPELNFDTVLTEAADAQAECTRRLGLYKVRRDMYQVQIKFNSTLADTIDLGSIVKIEISRYGLDSGKLFLVIGLQYDARASVLEMTLWG